MTSPILLTDRTTIETDWDCGMKRWWYKEHGGRGIVPLREPDYYKDGRIVHQALCDVMMGKEPDLGPEPTSIPALEKWLRFKGWVRAFQKWIAPDLLAQYDVLFTEHEVVLVRKPLWIAATPDLVLRHRITHKVVIIDYKTVGMLTRNWTLYWPYAIQMHILIKAIEEELGQEVQHAQVIGLMKGLEKGGMTRHPYTWAYTNGTKWSSRWASGWQLTLVNEFPGGIDAWVDQCGEDVGRNLFPFSAPIFLDERLLNQMLFSVQLREELIRDIRDDAQTDEALRTQHFTPRFTKCRPVVGSECPYLSACHNATIHDDPLGSGLYVPRTPHHDLELMTGDDDAEDDVEV